MLQREPSGAALAFEVEWLSRSWFHHYLMAGLFLAIVIGPANLASVVV